MVFAISCLLVGRATADVPQKLQDARRAVIEKRASAQSEIRRAIAGETDPRVRAGLVALLSATRLNDDSIETLRALLGDADPSVRAEAVVALAKSGHKKAPGDLINVLRSDANPGVRHTAAFWLGGLKHAAAVSALSDALTKDADPNVRAQAARSLRWIGTPAARAGLKRHQNDKERRVKQIANEP